MLETLEDRTVPTTLTVTNLNDSGAGSLRQAILDANNEGQFPGADTIVFQQTLAGVINLASVLPYLNTDISIEGPVGAPLPVTVRRDTGGDYRIFTVTGGATVVSILHLKIANGRSVSTDVSKHGGGIYNEGILTLTDCVIEGNSTEGSRGSPVLPAHGGGIYNTGTLTVSASMIGSEQGTCDTSTGKNSTLRGDGGGIYNHSSGTLTVTGNTKILRNRTFNSIKDPPSLASDGAGIYNGGAAEITSSTISYNCANADGGGLFNVGEEKEKKRCQEEKVSGTYFGK